MKKYIGTNTNIGQAALYYARKNRLERIAAEQPVTAHFIDENGNVFADQNNDQWAA